MNKAKPISRALNAVRRANAAQRSGGNRERLLQTGAEMFVEYGIAKVSVEQLIAKADILMPVKD
jgi:AcrR family transcriptional regulator